MFTLQDAAPGSLTAVDNSLLINAPDLTADQVAAASETHLYIQTVAQALVQQQGQDIGDPDLYKSEKWYRALTKATTEYATWVEIAEDKSATVNKSTHSGSINLSAIMGALMQFYLGATAAAEWSALSTILGGVEDPAVTDFMNFWWSRVHRSSTNTGLSVGPNTRTSDGQVEWAACYYSMSQLIDEWRTLFISSTYEQIDVSAAGLVLRMDLEIYTEDARAAVRDYLGADIKNKIKNAPVPRPNALFSLGLAGPQQTDLTAQILAAPRPSGSDNGQPDTPGGNAGGTSGGTGTGTVDAGDPTGQVGAPPVQVSRDVHDVTVLPLHGDAMLGGQGIGRVDFAGTEVTQLRCGIFAQGQPLPTVGQQYRVSGTYDDTQLPFTHTLQCTQAGRPASYFGPVAG